jgi:hypothetical protein
MAETAMQNTGTTGDKQCIGPMSRNFNASVTTAHPTWSSAVIGLDAVVIVEQRRLGHMRNLALPVKGGVIDPNTSPSNFTLFQPGSGYTQILEIILAGTDGSGSVAACSDPRRINAIADLAAMQGTASGTINHFYRLDDNSGTTDTIKEKLHIQRFCNGAARGSLGSNTANPNLNNQDFDPIRRPCEALRTGWNTAKSRGSRKVVIRLSAATTSGIPIGSSIHRIPESTGDGLATQRASASCLAGAQTEPPTPKSRSRLRLHAPRTSPKVRPPAASSNA